MKMVKAAHFNHTGRVVPQEAGLYVEWRGNAEEAEEPPPAELLETLQPANPIRRARVDLNPQFRYRYQVSADGAAGTFYFWFYQTFAIVGLMNFERDKLEPPG